MIFVSVIVPTYNLADYIAETLDSIRAQTFTDFEAIIIDDGSTDDTAAVVKPYLSDSRFVYIQQENQGTSAARNTGIARAQGEWIAFLDADDLWLPEKLAKQVDIIKTSPDVALVFGNGIEFTEDGDFGPFYRRREKFPEGYVLERMLRCNCFWSCSVMVKRREVLDVGMLDGSLSGVDDYDLWIKILERGGTARGVWEPVARYRKRGDSQGGIKAQMFELQKRVFENLLTRQGDPALKRIAAESLARTHGDLVLTQARCSLADAGVVNGSVRALLYKAWKAYPARRKPLYWALISYFGFSGYIARKLTRKW